MRSEREYELTINEIAVAEDLHPQYVQKLTREKGVPEPVRRIGVNKMFDPTAVAAFFDERRKRKAQRSAKKRAKRRCAA